MSRAHDCDGCGKARLTWKRLCEPCYARLPASVRTRLVLAYRRGETKAWRTARREARQLLRDLPIFTVSPQTAYARAQAITGDRD